MSVNWKDGTTPISELNLDNFPDFAREYAQFTYLMCYKASMDEKTAVSLSADALAAVACQESTRDESRNLTASEAIKRVLLDVLSKRQLSRMNNDDFKTDKVADVQTVNEIVDRATNIANINMPRYARVFSGTKGTLVIIGLIAVLLAVIVMIWLNPLSCNSVAGSAQTSGVTGTVLSAVRPDVDMLINVEFDDSGAKKINSGAYPVMFAVDGPDSRLVTSTNVYGSDGTVVAVYPCGENRYCFIATESDVYRVDIGSDMGNMSAYHIVPELDEYKANGVQTMFYVISHNDTAVISLGAGETISAEPSGGTLERVLSSYIYTPAEGGDGIGLDTFSYTKADGTVITVPILISNSTPYIEPSHLSVDILHTPSRAGMYAGVIGNSDADGDDVSFTMTESSGCSVLLSSNGSYVALIEPEYRLEKASFSFTVSDGIIVSQPYTVDINLSNNLMAATEIAKDFVCYAGEEYYTFELPARDDDGDLLTWSLVTDNNGGVTTQWKSEVIIENGNVVRYHISPEINRDFVEALTFSCTDGWLSGTLMTVICNNRENLAPVSSGRNNATVSSEPEENILEVTVNDDCEFDRCEITSVEGVFGGEVPNDKGWDEMKFTFIPDGTEEYASVILTVTDVCTGRSVQIVYDIYIR